MLQPTRLISTPFAQEGEKTEIQNVTGEFDNSATYRLGFPPLTMQSIRSGGKPPKGTDFNGVLFDITENISFLCKGGRYQYNAGLSTLIGGYPEGSNLLLDDNVTEVVSTVAGNQNDPNTDMTGWVLKPNKTSTVDVLDASGLNQAQINALKTNNSEVLPQTQTKDSFKNAYSSKLTNRFNRVKDLCSVGRSYVWKNPKYTSDSAYKFSVGLNMNGWTTIEWDFIADVDNFWRMRYGFTGAIRSPSVNVDATGMSIAPIRTGDNAYFRSSDGLNATFNVVFTGTGFLFNHYVDGNGGIFEVSVDGVARGTVSCNSSNPENASAQAMNISKLIVDGLSNSSHTATFKFIGNDPSYPPTSGTSRGWFKLSDGVAPEAYTASIITGSEMGIADTRGLLVSNGILEFAIGAAPTGVEGITPDWIPAHGSASGCIVVSERKLFVDGIEYLGFSSAEMAFNEFTMRQKYTAYNSADTSKLYPMWSGVLYTKFDKQRGLTYSHEFTTLREIQVSDGYTAMASGRRTSNLSKITFDNGLVLDISGATPSAQITHFPGVFKSVSWTGSKTALALNIESIEASSAIGTDLTDGVATVSTERPDGFCKVYAKPLGTNKVIPSGVTVSSTHSIWLATF